MAYLKASVALFFTGNLSALAEDKRPGDWVEPKIDTIAPRFTLDDEEVSAGYHKVVREDPLQSATLNREP